ncbi:MAG: endonuclease domain-containing protein [Methyloligellaceae bacterium]
MPNENARHMRKNPTDAEKALWSRLRGKRLDNFRFRRQQPIDGYIVDFICFEARLVIELDGEYHNDPEAIDYDTTRTEWLNNHNFLVIRFNNHEVFENMEKVLQTIKQHLPQQ